MNSLSGSNSAVECDLAKVEVAGSNPVSRSNVSRKDLSSVLGVCMGYVMEEPYWYLPLDSYLVLFGRVIIRCLNRLGSFSSSSIARTYTRESQTSLPASSRFASSSQSPSASASTSSPASPPELAAPQLDSR